MTVGMADNLTPYDESAGDDQDEPFLFEATGTGNGSQPDFATGSAALMKEKRGNSVVVNQLIQNGNFANTNNWTTAGASLSVSNNVGTITFNGAQYGRIYQSVNIVNGHKYLLVFSAKSSAIDQIMISGAEGWHFKNLNSSWTTLFDLTTASETETQSVIFGASTPTNDDTIDIKDISFIDLTQWFNGNDNIPADLLSHPENWYRYYQDDLSHNTGTIVNANSRYIKCIGRNQWDEETINGYYDANTGSFVENASIIACKNPIRIIGGNQYYVKCPNDTSAVILFYDIDGTYMNDYAIYANQTFNTPSNAKYIKFYMNAYGATYNHDITLSLYYSGESGYDQYYPYEVLTNNDTGTEELKSAGNVADYKTPDGVVHHLVGSVDLGSLNYDYVSIDGQPCFQVQILDMKSFVDYSSDNYNILNVLYTKASWNNNRTENNYDMTIAIASNYISIRNSNYTDATAFKTAMSGVYLYYELATPTTEQGTLFSENLVIDDFGSMEFSGTSGVPQGNLIFYPVDYKAFVDTLYDYTEGTPSDIQLKSELSTAIATFLTGITGYDATKKQTLKNNQGTLSWEDDE